MRIQIRFRIQLITLMWIQIRIFIWCGWGSGLLKWCGSMQIHEDPDADPYPQHCIYDLSYLLQSTGTNKNQPCFILRILPHTVIRFVWVSAKFGTCTVVSVNGTLVEAKMWTFTLESTHFIFNKCPIYTHDGASSKFSTNSEETDYSAAFSLLHGIILQIVL
jgi:hypothetical protein